MSIYGTQAGNNRPIMKVKFYNKYPTDIDIDTEINVEVYVDEFNMSEVPKGHIRIVVLEEPSINKVFHLARKHTGCYTHLLTYQDELLRTNPKASLFRGADIWLKGYTPPYKKFCVSTVIGGKRDPSMSGYALRHDLWHSQGRITAPKEFYLSSQYKFDGADYHNSFILGDSKEPLFNSMFHVAIENTPIKHYFSEKLLDCFQTHTVPIYCGCTNIYDYFDISGIFVARNINDIVNICNSLTPDIYKDMMPAMDNNFNLAQPRSNYFKQLENAIIQIIKNA